MDRLSLIFSPDGMLRCVFPFVQNNDWCEALVPIATVEEYHMPALFLRALDGTVQIETGTRLVHFMNALRPWTKQFSDMLDIDLAAYIAEANQPIALEKRLDLKHIIVQGSLSFVPMVGADKNALEVLAEAQETRVLNMPPRIPLDRIELEIIWHASAYEKDDASGLATSISEDPLNALAHTPLCISEVLHISDQTLMLPNSVTVEESLLNANSPFVIDQPWGKHHGRLLTARAEMAPTFKEAVVAILHEVAPYRSPQRRKDRIEERRRQRAINEALDAQEGYHRVEGATNVGRGAFQVLFNDLERISAESLDLLRRAGNAKGVIIRPVQQKPL